MLDKTEKNTSNNHLKIEEDALHEHNDDGEEGLPTRRRRHTSYVSRKDENQVRGNWSGKMDFIFSMMSFAVGLGNVWRFPYKCYQNGGGAFLIPFCIMLVLAGLPMMFLETAFGQYASAGVVSVWKASLLFQGLGYAMFLVSFSVAIYYNIIISWTFFYLFSSFRTVLPWAHCGHEWNTDACKERVYGEDLRAQKQCNEQGGFWWNTTCLTANSTDLWPQDAPIYQNYSGSENASHALLAQLLAQNQTNVTSKSPSDEFFHNYILNISEGLDDLGGLRWQLVLCLLLSWTIICVCMIKGIKSSGRAVYFTSTFPYLVLTILLIRALTLEGSGNGIRFYLSPRWEMLLQPKVWGEAAVQIFFNLAPGWGPLIVLSSYNKFKNNCLRDALIVSISGALTSIFAGFVIFAIIGYMAFLLDKPIDKVLDEGPGLAFIVYPEVVTQLPASPVWAILFFLMFISLGIGTEFGLINTVHTTIMDIFPNFFHHGWRPSVLMVGLCVTQFLLGLAMCTRAGMYLLILFDSYAPTYAVLIIAITECVALGWVYGFPRFQGDIKLMLGSKISIFWRVMWQFITPITLVGVLVFLAMTASESKYQTYVFPLWSDMMGMVITVVVVSVIPGVAVYKIFTMYPEMPLLKRIQRLCQPTDDWGPGLFRSEEIRNIIKERQTVELTVDDAHPLKGDVQLHSEPGQHDEKKYPSFAEA